MKRLAEFVLHVDVAMDYLASGRATEITIYRHLYDPNNDRVLGKNLWMFFSRIDENTAGLSAARPLPIAGVSAHNKPIFFRIKDKEQRAEILTLIETAMRKEYEVAMNNAMLKMPFYNDYFTEVTHPARGIKKDGTLP